MWEAGPCQIIKRSVECTEWLVVFFSDCAKVVDSLSPSGNKVTGSLLVLPANEWVGGEGGKTWGPGERKTPGSSVY